jgi:hypothetical protein
MPNANLTDKEMLISLSVLGSRTIRGRFCHSEVRILSGQPASPVSMGHFRFLKKWTTLRHLAARWLVSTVEK